MVSEILLCCFSLADRVAIATYHNSYCLLPARIFYFLCTMRHGWLTFVAFFIFSLFGLQASSNCVLHYANQFIAWGQTPLCLRNRHRFSSHYCSQGSIKETHEAYSGEECHCILMLKNKFINQVEVFLLNKGSIQCVWNLLNNFSIRVCEREIRCENVRAGVFKGEVQRKMQMRTLLPRLSL